jgi:SAM-dependent methyltransferase
VAPAEHSGLADHSADLVVAAQAAHWFNLPAFWHEVARIARPAGLAALVSYGSITVSPELDRLLRRFHDETLRDFWPAERWLVTRGYRDILFPLDEIALPPVSMTLDWTFGQMLAYLGTWSGVKAADRALGTSVLAEIAPKLESAWGDPQTRRTISWPLAIRAGRVDAAAIAANT